MERFKLKNGVLMPPARNAVTTDGRVISNFDVLVANDADFAAQNGYYPKGHEPQVPPTGELAVSYHLVDGVWQGELVAVEIPPELRAEVEKLRRGN